MSREAREEFGLAIKARMQDREIKTGHLSKLLGVSETAVRNWINAQNSCGRYLAQLTDVLFPGTGRFNKERRTFTGLYDAAWGSELPTTLPLPETPPQPTGKFLFAGKEYEMLVMDFCPVGYPYDQFCSTLVEWVEPDMPEAWQERYKQAYADAEGQKAARQINDNPIVALREVRPRREGKGEPQGFFLTYSDINYVAKRASILFYKNYLTEAEKEVLIKDVQDWQLHPILSRCLNTQVAVITCDKKFMFARRSSQLINAGKVACGIAETMEDGDKISTDGHEEPDVFRAALRGLTQEAGITFEGTRTDPHSVVKFISLSFDTEYYEPQFIGLADFRHADGKLRERTSAESIAMGLKRGAARDKWENKEILFIDFELEPVFTFVAANPLTPYGMLAVVQAFQAQGRPFKEIEAAYQDALDHKNFDQS